MARYERDPRAEPGKVGDGAGKVRMRRDENGRLVPVLDAKPKVPTTEVAETPPMPDDPNPGGVLPPGYR
jgi:hypothetical protein